MKTLIVFLMLHRTVLMITAQQLKLPLHTIRIPAGSMWGVCSKSPMVASYAIKLADPNAILDPTNYDGIIEPLESKLNVKGIGFIAAVGNLMDEFVEESLCTAATEPYEVSACAKEFKFPTGISGTWCLIIVNRFLNYQNIDVVYSFTQSVFMEGSYRIGDNVEFALKKNDLFAFSLDEINNIKKRNFRRSKPLRLESSF
ncbi:14483_t:CDS:2 [Funneliformis mosseae]|uniref:14483_t:CDS:1 n=1 Tax=Funneliformis mosseae TaxID=27381 RepID=A0A9N9GX03_FUNMO|nr:14483_t:CDS:2 [Funneliformis mosseae]